MPTAGANVAVIRAGQVLLTKRHDLEVWCLPGGHVDDGASLAQAAAREMREETELEVRLTSVAHEDHGGAGRSCCPFPVACV